MPGPREASIFITHPPRRLLLAVLALVSFLTWPYLFEGSHPEVLYAFISLGTLGPEALLIFVMFTAALSSIPPIAITLHRMLDKLRVATGRHRSICTVTVTIVSIAYLSLTALAQHRQFFPYVHDEFSYLIQARQLARGHQWMPAHPLGDFFDSFQLLVQPVYASAYFPGTALLYVPGIWLHLPPCVTSMVIAGLVAGLMFWITAELLDGVWACLAVLLLNSDGLYRQLSIMTLAQLPLLLFSLSAVVAWLRWRVTGKTKFAVCIGVFIGLSAITRPVDALCFAVPIFIAVIVTRASGPCHNRVKAVSGIMLGILPFLILQLELNHGVTRHWLQSPFSLYADRDYPGTSYGFHAWNPSAVPASTLTQKRMLYETYRTQIRDHQPAYVLDDLFPFRLRETLSLNSPVPFPLLVLLIPFSLLRLNKSRAVMLVTLPLFLGLYAAYVFFLPHYVMVAAPGVIIGILAGADAIIGGTRPLSLESLATPRGRAIRRFSTVALTLFIAGNAIAALPQWSDQNDDAFSAPLIASVNAALANLPLRPAVVLFTFGPARNLSEEPVYNADAAWPDDADVIRAHDLGPKNVEIFRYFATHQPRRFFYRFDESTGKIQPLGIASEMGR